MFECVCACKCMRNVCVPAGVSAGKGEGVGGGVV